MNTKANHKPGTPEQQAVHLEVLNRKIAEGVEFPDAVYQVTRLFPACDHEVLTAAYDAQHA